jgi:hypothetical protein
MKSGQKYAYNENGEQQFEGEMHITDRKDND